VTAAESDRSAAIGRVLEEFIEVNRVIAPPRVTPFAGLELGRSHLEALFLIAHRNSVTPGALAAAMRITAGAVTQLIAKLREAELVTATPSPTDSRSIILALAGSAQRELVEFEARAVRDARPHFASLTTSDLDRLAALLRSVTDRP
jgi:DNA-binding MarR family transcriptional regulator